jgi:hypothetical protein
MLEAEVVEGLERLAAPVPEGTLEHWRRFGVSVGAMVAYQELAARTLWAYRVGEVARMRCRRDSGDLAIPLEQ